LLAKLAGMELPEPTGAYEEVVGKEKWQGFESEIIEMRDAYSATQLHQAYAQGAASQLAEQPYAWIVTTEMQDGTSRTYPLTGRYKDILAVCDSGRPTPHYTLKEAK